MLSEEGVLDLELGDDFGGFLASIDEDLGLVVAFGEEDVTITDGDGLIAKVEGVVVIRGCLLGDEVGGEYGFEWWVEQLGIDVVINLIPLKHHKQPLYMRIRRLHTSLLIRQRKHL